MRFLRFNDHGEPSLVTRGSDNIPAYAILSHTWGADNEEVTYDDLIKGTGTQKVGYEKIRFCARRSDQDGLRFFWVDTCCINKANFTELSEAINSMFKWYRESTRCYVYLSDVPDPKSAASTVELAFPKSRWFKRGWTLQELLAPSSVQFFSRTGELLGSKKSRVQEIHQITGIDVEALQGNCLSEFSVGKRISWATGRQTKVEEDAAYCLLGIFDINMSLIYGEGRQRAFDRLHRKVAKSGRTTAQLGVGESPIPYRESLNPEKKLLRGVGEESPPHRELSKPVTELQVLKGHSNRLRSVAFSPDGELLASASEDKTVRLWYARSGVLREILVGHSSGVECVAFSPDSKLLASASGDLTVRLWDGRSGVALQTLKGHSNLVNAVAFSPDCKLLVSASSDRTIKLWDVQSRTVWTALEGHLTSIYSVAFSPDGKLIASSDADGTVILWDGQSGVVRQTIKSYPTDIRTVAFSADGMLLVSAPHGKAFKLWDVHSGVIWKTLEDHAGYVTAVAFSPNGMLLASGSGDKTVKLWDVRSGTVQQTLEGHSDWVFGVAFSPDGKLLASASYDCTIRLWRMWTPESASAHHR